MQSSAEIIEKNASSFKRKPNGKPDAIIGLRLSKNCRLIQKEDELQGEKAWKRGLAPFSILDNVSVCEKVKLFRQTEPDAIIGL